jgi:hypothetical protein
MNAIAVSNSNARIDFERDIVVGPLLNVVFNISLHMGLRHTQESYY